VQHSLQGDSEKRPEIRVSGIQIQCPTVKANRILASLLVRQQIRLQLMLVCPVQKRTVLPPFRLFLFDDGGSTPAICLFITDPDEASDYRPCNRHIVPFQPPP